MNGLIHIYFGGGKGKTTAAMGLISRFLGHDKKVLLVQFMKFPQEQFGQYGEIISFKENKNFVFKQFGSKNWVIKSALTKEAINGALEALNFLKSAVASNDFDLIVADELLYCIDLGLLKEIDVISVIKSKSPNIELVITGSHKEHEGVFALGDYVTNFKKVKHPFDKGILARESVEF
jgi:cob(I)alamin adenosyltransferase